MKTPLTDTPETDTPGRSYIARRLLSIVLVAFYLGLGGLYLRFLSGLNNNGFNGNLYTLQEVSLNTGEFSILCQEIRGKKEKLKAAGLVPGDCVLTINGAQWDNISAFFTGDWPWQKKISYSRGVLGGLFPPGEEIRLELLRGNQIKSVMVPYEPLGLAGISKTLYMKLLSGSLLVFLAFFVLWKRPDLKTARLFLIYAVLEALLSATSAFNNFWPPVGQYYGNIGPPLLEFLSATVFLHFALYFPADQSRFSRYLPWLYLAGAVFVGLYIFSYVSLTGPFETGYWLRKIFKMMVFAGGVALLVTRFFRGGLRAYHRQQIKWILVGISVYTLSLVSTFYIPSLLERGDLSYYSATAQIINSFTFLAIPLSFLFAVIRYSLFDIDSIIIRTLNYTLLSAVILGFYFLLVALFDSKIVPYLDLESRWAGFLTLLVALVGMNPLRMQIQRLVDRAFYRGRLDEYETLSRISSEVYRQTDEKNILRYALENLVQILGLTHAVCYLPDNKPGDSGEEGVPYKVSAPHHHTSLTPEEEITFENLPADAHTRRLVARLSEKEDGFENLRSGGRLAERWELRGPAAELLTHCGHDWIIGLKLNKEFTGFICLGQKLNGGLFLGREKDLVLSVLRAMSLAMENARLYEKQASQERTRQELKLAHTMQQTLLPRELPKMGRLRLAAGSVPARDIGGDFYDIYPTGRDRWEVVAGDVSGKGLPAGLVAAITTGICQGRPKQMNDAGKVMAEVNNSLCRAHIKGHFVAMTYLICDPGEGTVSLANAGFPYPVFLNDKGARYLKIGGLPLGMMPSLKYKTGQLKIKPGDVLILASDGIVESRSESGELLGFDRFLDFCQDLADMEPDEILRRIFDFRAAFAAGEEEQPDDTTVLVLKVGTEHVEEN